MPISIFENGYSLTLDKNENMFFKRKNVFLIVVKCINTKNKYYCVTKFVKLRNDISK